MTPTVWIALVGAIAAALTSLLGVARLMREWKGLKLSQEKALAELEKARADLQKLSEESAERERLRTQREEERMERERSRFALSPECLEEHVVGPLRVELRERAEREARVTIEGLSASFARAGFEPLSRELTDYLNYAFKGLSEALNAKIDQRLRGIEETLEKKKGILW